MASSSPVPKDYGGDDFDAAPQLLLSLSAQPPEKQLRDVTTSDAAAAAAPLLMWLQSGDAGALDAAADDGSGTHHKLPWLCSLTWACPEDAPAERRLAARKTTVEPNVTTTGAASLVVSFPPPSCAFTARALSAAVLSAQPARAADAAAPPLSSPASGALHVRADAPLMWLVLTGLERALLARSAPLLAFGTCGARGGHSGERGDAAAAPEAAPTTVFDDLAWAGCSSDDDAPAAEARRDGAPLTAAVAADASAEGDESLLSVDDFESRDSLMLLSFAVIIAVAVIALLVSTSYVMWFFLGRRKDL